MQQRENRNSNIPQPLGICRRLLNFIMHILTERGLPRLTNPPASQSIAVPVEGSSAFREEPDYHPENSNSAIRVVFTHTNGLEHHVAKNDNPTVNAEKGGIRPVEIGTVRPSRKAETDSRGRVNGQELDSITTGGSRGKLPTKVVSTNVRGGEKEMIDSRGQVNGQELDSITTGGSQGKLPTKVVSTNERGGEKEKNNNKDKSTVAAATATATEEPEDRPMMPPFDFLENDINGRADEFIRQRKMDFLRRNTTLDLQKSNS